LQAARRRRRRRTAEKNGNLIGGIVGIQRKAIG